MKTSKIIFIGLLALLPVITSANIQNDLKYGSKGAEVTELQEFLIDKGFLHSEATGNFYTLTKSAVMAYQTSENLPSTGFVGPLTRGKINAVLAVDDSAEIDETGTVTPPVVAVSPDTLALKQTLDSLLAQVKSLQDQQKALADAQKATTQETNTKLGTIVTNTTPLPPAPQPAIIVPMDKSAITVETIKSPVTSLNSSGAPYGNYTFNVVVLDKDGKRVKDASVLMEGEDSTFWTNPPSPQVRNTDGVTGAYAIGKSIMDDWHTTFSLVPKTLGTKTYTFTSGNLSATTTIEVQ